VTERRLGIEGALPERYAVERELGRGGTARVYLATDRTTGRRVAIKILLPDYARVVGAQRFHREIALLGGLHHPNILPLLDSGQAGALPFYVMPYATGESLRDRLERTPQFSLADTIAVARGVAAALDYAHGRNVVHRDIKPENILFEGARPLVCDFGVARAIVEAGGEALSSSGLIVGTPDYMSPEQAGGARLIDARSDLYGFGCVVYEMLVGEPPFTGATLQAVLARHVAERPRSLRIVRPDLAGSVEAAVFAALAKAPADRPESATALVARLDAGSGG